MIYFLEESLKKETYETFHLHKYVNILQLSNVDIVSVLYVACKYLFGLSLDSLLLLYIALCILGKWQQNLSYYFQVKGLLTRLNWYKDDFKDKGRWPFFTLLILCCDSNLGLQCNLPRLGAWFKDLTGFFLWRSWDVSKRYQSFFHYRKNASIVGIRSNSERNNFLVFGTFWLP